MVIETVNWVEELVNMKLTLEILFEENEEKYAQIECQNKHC